MIQRHSWYDNVAIRLRFTAVFQGGGIRGLFFPGHVFGLIKEGVTKIGAYSGASAGAIIAIGLWSGLLPHRILEELNKKSGFFGLLRPIISFYDIIQLFYGIILFVIIEFINLTMHFAWRMLFLRRFFKRDAPPLLMYYGCRGKKFENFINSIILSGLNDRGLHSRLISDVTGKDPSKNYLTFRDVFEITYWARFVSSVTSLTDVNFKKIITVYPHLDLKKEKLVFDLVDRHGEKKNNILDEVYGLPTASDPYFYPVFLSLCDIKTRRPVIVSSIDPDCLDVPIARAVRISAGHPFVFQPYNVKVGNSSPLCTDGGLIYNLPTITLYRDLPRLLRLIDSGNHPYIGPKDFEHTDLIKSPLTIIGLSSEDFSSNSTYVGSLFSTISGGNRSYLEYKLAEFAPYIRHIQHKTNLGEPHFLNFAAARKKYIRTCFNNGEDFIKSNGFVTRITLEEYKYQIQKIVEDISIFVRKALELEDKDFVRAHFFVEGKENQGVLDKKLFSYNGEDGRTFEDEDSSMNEHGRYAGIVGLCVLSGKMIVGRLDILQHMRKSKPAEEFLNLKWDQVFHIPDDVTFCFAIPVYDFRQIHYEIKTTSVNMVAGYDDCVATIDCGVSGPIAGVLSIDISVSPEKGLSSLIESLLENFTIQTLERLVIGISSIISDAMSAAAPA